MQRVSGRNMAGNVRELRPRAGDSEKITINLGYVDLGQVDLLVREGFYSNRTDFIRTAIRNQLDRQNDALKERVVTILRPLYETADDWRRLVQLNEDRYALASEGEKVAVLRETATLWETRGNDKKRARRALGAAVRLDPDDADVRHEFERLVGETKAWDEIARVYEETLAELRDLYHRLGAVLFEVLTSLVSWDGLDETEQDRHRCHPADPLRARAGDHVRTAARTRSAHVHHRSRAEEQHGQGHDQHHDAEQCVEGLPGEPADRHLG